MEGWIKSKVKGKCARRLLDLRSMDEERTLQHSDHPQESKERLTIVERNSTTSDLEIYQVNVISWHIRKRHAVCAADRDNALADSAD